RCYADDAPGVTETVELLADAGAAGCSSEDWNPMTNAIDPVDTAAERGVAAGAEVVYAPGLADTGQISRLTSAVGVPVNVLILPGGPSVAQLGEAGVR